MSYASAEHMRRRTLVLENFGKSIRTADEVGHLLYPERDRGKRRHAASMTLLRMWDDLLAIRLDDGRWRIGPFGIKPFDQQPKPEETP